MTLLNLAQPPRPSFLGGPPDEPSDRAPVLSHRNEAVRVCNWWSSAIERLKSPSNRAGFLSRSVLLARVDALEGRALSFAPPAAEHPEARAARLAVVDWIRMTVRQRPKHLRMKSVQFLNRFFWGDVEHTEAYGRFFDLRCGRRGATPRDPAAPRGCFVGFAYGAPSMLAMVSGTAGAPRGRGAMRSLGIDNQFWAVHAKNRAGQKLASMVLSQDHSRRLNEQEATQVLELLQRPLLGLPGGPQFIVQRGKGPRMRLGLRRSRSEGLSARSAIQLDGMKALQQYRLGLFELVPMVLFTDFTPTTADGEWGTFERLEWFLEPVPPAARRHSQLFSHHG